MKAPRGETPDGAERLREGKDETFPRSIGRFERFDCLRGLGGGTRNTTARRFFPRWAGGGGERLQRTAERGAGQFPIGRANAAGLAGHTADGAAAHRARFPAGGSPAPL